MANGIGTILSFFILLGVGSFLYYGLPSKGASIVLEGVPETHDPEKSQLVQQALAQALDLKEEHIQIYYFHKLKGYDLPFLDLWIQLQENEILDQPKPLGVFKAETFKVLARQSLDREVVIRGMITAVEPSPVPYKQGGWETSKDRKFMYKGVSALSR